MAEVIWGSSAKPASSRKLAEGFEAARDLNGTLYIGYPILGTPTGAFPIDATFLSPDHGMVVFDVVEGRDPSGFEDRQDEMFTKMKSRLMQFPGLVQRRDLGAQLSVASFAPAAPAEKLQSDGDYLILNSETLEAFINSINWPNKQLYPALASAIQSLSTIRKGRRKREAAKPDSRGAKVRKLEESIANFRRRSRCGGNRNSTRSTTNSGTGRIRKNHRPRSQGRISPCSESRLEDRCNVQYSLT